MGHVAHRSLCNLTKYINLLLIVQHLVKLHRLQRTICPIFCHILVTVRSHDPEKAISSFSLQFFRSLFLTGKYPTFSCRNSRSQFCSFFPVTFLSKFLPAIVTFSNMILSHEHITLLRCFMRVCHTVSNYVKNDTHRIHHQVYTSSSKPPSCLYK